MEEPQEIETLLPWHAIGTLSRHDAQRVEAALKADSELARRFEMVREEQVEAIHLNEMLGAPSARAMEKLFAAIDQEALVARRSSFQLGARLSAFIANVSPRALAWSASAAAVVLVLQGGLITSLMQERLDADLASYRDVNLTGPTGLVSFAPQASATDIEKFLDAYKATLIDGPKNGYFRFRISGVASKDDLTKVVVKMQHEKTVVAFVSVSQ
jgi:anti-sigma factor RsiW